MFLGCLQFHVLSVRISSVSRVYLPDTCLTGWLCRWLPEGHLDVLKVVNALGYLVFSEEALAPFSPRPTTGMKNQKRGL